MATTEQLQTWLSEAEAALHARITGQHMTTISHNNDGGGRSASFADMDENALRRYIADLERRLGQVKPKWPIKI